MKKKRINKKQITKKKKKKSIPYNFNLLNDKVNIR